MKDYKKYEPIFGAWYLNRLIGKGSFGKVYEITREEFGTTYKAALKVISVPQDEDDVKAKLSEGTDIGTICEYYEGILKEIINENKIMSRLKGNSNIVSYEDHQIIEHEDSVGYDILIRMELLTPLLNRMLEKRLSEEEVVHLGIDICKALEVCHGKNIIHRDIKPQNIFISENGDYKLGDFGIAKTMEKTTGGMSKKGTYKYMAPEVFRGEEYDLTVDIYSLGIVLYSLLNGNRGPFLPPPPEKVTHNDEEAARMRRFRGEPIPPPRDAGPMLAYIIIKACAANPQDRYRNAKDFRSDLESYLKNYNNPSNWAEDGFDDSATVLEDNPEVQPSAMRYTGGVPADQVMAGMSRNTGQYNIPYEPGPYNQGFYGNNQAAYGGQNAGRMKLLPLLLAVGLAFIMIVAGAFVLIKPGEDSDEGGKNEFEEKFEEKAEDNEFMQGAFEFDGHHFKIFNDHLTWREAQDLCEENDGHLVTLETADKYDEIVKAIEEDGIQNWHYWLGATDEEREGEWKWVTGDAVFSGFTRWDNTTNQPNDSEKTDPVNGEDYMEMQATTGDDGLEYMTWNDICNEGVAYGYEEAPEFCSRKYFGYICEWDY